jgi:hypothetical protein
LHREAALGDERECVLERKRTRERQAAKLCEGVTRGHDRFQPLGGRCREGIIHDVDCGLAELRFPQPFLRAVTNQRQQIVAENAFRPREEIRRNRNALGERHAHADGLRALPGKNDADAHQALHRQAIEPHERPPPKPVKRTRSPALSEPRSIVSESAIGIEADDVLP